MMGIHSSPRMLNRALQTLALLVALLMMMLVALVSVHQEAKAEPAMDGIYLVNMERGQAAKAPVSMEQDSTTGLMATHPVHERNGSSRWRTVMDEHRIISACWADVLLCR